MAAVSRNPSGRSATKSTQPGTPGSPNGSTAARRNPMALPYRKSPAQMPKSEKPQKGGK